MFKLLSQRKEFLVFIISCLLSQIGAGLTQVAVFGYLSQSKSTQSDFALTFVLAVLPALFSSALAAKLIKRYRLDTLLTAAQVIGMFSVLVPLWGVYSNNLIFLQFAEFITAAVFGFVYPISQTYIRRLFDERDLPAVAKIDTFVFSVNIFIGIGIGTLFFSVFGPKVYLLINMLCYFSAIVLILTSARMNRSSFDRVKSIPTETNKQALRFTSEQWDAFKALPALAVLGSVLMALSPTFGLSKASYVIPGIQLAVSPVLLLLFSRCLGQMIGPIVVPKSLFSNLANSLWLKLGTLSMFLGLYVAAYYADHLFLKCTFIILAHVFSNIFFVLGMFSLQSKFSPEQIGQVAARQYQTQLIIMIICPLLSGWLIGHTGFVGTALLFFFASLLGVSFNIEKLFLYCLDASRTRRQKSFTKAADTRKG